MTLLACGLCGGVVEPVVLGAVGAATAGSVVFTGFYNKVRLALHNRNKQRIANHRLKRHCRHNLSK